MHPFFHFAAIYLIVLIGIFKFFDQMKFLENSAAVCSADKIPLAKTAYSKVLNNHAARLLIFKFFSYQHGLIWNYTLIKIQIIFLPRALYMGELRKNTTSTRTITKKPGNFGKFETVGTKKFIYEVNFFHSLIKLNSSLI